MVSRSVTESFSFRLLTYDYSYELGCRKLGLLAECTVSGVENSILGKAAPAQLASRSTIAGENGKNSVLIL